MIVAGFFQQVFDRITIDSVREALGDAIGRRVREYRRGLAIDGTIPLPNPRLHSQPMSEFVRVCKISDLPDPGKTVVEVDDRLVAPVPRRRHVLGDRRRLHARRRPAGRRRAGRPRDRSARGTGRRFDIRTGRALTHAGHPADRGPRGEGRRRRGVRPPERQTPSRAMPIAEESVYAALRQVHDPELFVNIVDLGLIYEVNARASRTGSRTST